jgi:hypothetical protein
MDLINHIEKAIEEEKKFIIERAEAVGFNGDFETELFSIDMKHGFDSYDWRDMENHNYEIGKLKAFEEILELIKK